MPESSLPHAAQTALATIVRRAVVAAANGLDFTPPDELLAGALAEPGACFVTLQRGHRLRGCIGSIEARLPLGLDSALNARAATIGDTRFAPVEPSELPEIAIQLSILTRPEPLGVASRAELLAALVPGVDGLVLEERGQRATFLPAVWSQIREPESFVAHLELKAGLAAGSWSAARRAFRYRAESIAVGPALG